MESAYSGNEIAESSAIAFIKDVAALYHRNIWLFWKMLLPAAIFGYFVLFLSLDRAYDIVHRLPHGLDMLRYHKFEFMEATLLRFGGYAADWVIYCFAFAGVAAAVDKLEAGKYPSVEACFTGARDRLLRFFSLSLSLFIICLLAIVVWEVLFVLLVPLGRIPMLSNPLISLSIFFVPIWAVSRFGLAVPAFVLEKTSITKSFFRSDELTEGCWTILAILLLESVGGSYLVYLLIHWLAWQAANHGIAPSWTTNLGLPLGLLIGFVLEPHMFIGFALLYVRRSAQPDRSSALSAKMMV